MRLPEHVRPILKRPLGELFPDVGSALERIKEIRPNKVIAVGDVVTAELMSAGFKPDIAVIDLKVMREPASGEIGRRVEAFEASVIEVKNPAGTLTPELINAPWAGGPLEIIVRGEEDLATIPAVLGAPLGSVVLYGQPGEGVVLVHVTERKKEEFRGLLGLFERS